MHSFVAVATFFPRVNGDCTSQKSNVVEIEDALAYVVSV